MSFNDKQHPATKLVTSGRRDEWTGTAAHPAAVVSPPVWRASTHLYPDMAPCARKPGGTRMGASITAAVAPRRNGRWPRL
jgi:cystathionine beta-lyase